MMVAQLPLPKGHNPQFSAHICYGQMAGWSKMSLRMEVGQDFSLITTVNNSLNIDSSSCLAVPLGKFALC